MFAVYTLGFGGSSVISGEWPPSRSESSLSHGRRSVESVTHLGTQPEKQPIYMYRDSGVDEWYQVRSSVEYN